MGLDDIRRDRIKLGSANLLGFPQMLLLDPSHEVSELIDRKLEIFDYVVQCRGERIVISVRENVVDATIFKQVLLKPDR